MEVAAGEEVQARLRAEIERREAELARARHGRAGSPAAAERRGLERRLRFLRQVAAALPPVDAAELPERRAGVGSVLFVREQESGRERVYRLMPEPLDRLDAAQVALGSALGRALPQLLGMTRTATSYRLPAAGNPGCKPAAGSR